MIAGIGGNNYDQNSFETAVISACHPADVHDLQLLCAGRGDFLTAEL